MDLSVRDTWEITPDQVTLTGLDWDMILAEVRDELGLRPRVRLRAEPHALLVYGKGPVTRSSCSNATSSTNRRSGNALRTARAAQRSPSRPGGWPGSGL